MNDDFNLGKILVRKLSKDFLVYLPSKFIPAFVAFVSIPIFTRLFLPSEYGVYSLVFSAVTLITSIVFGWLTHSSLRFFDEHGKVGEKNRFISTIFFSWFAGLVCCLIFSIVILIVIRQTIFFETVRHYFVVASFSFLMLGSQSMYSIILQLLRAKRSSIAFALMSIILPLGKLLTVLWLVSSRGLGIESMFISMFIFESILSMFGLWVIKPALCPMAFSVAILKRIISYGFPVTITSLLVWILAVSDRYIIGYYHGTGAVGIYSIAYNLGAQSIQLIFLALMLASFPVIVQTWNEHGCKSTEELISALLKYYSLLTIPIIAGVIVLGRPILAVFTTDVYIAGYTVLPWVTAALFFLGYSQYVNKVWELTEKTSMLIFLNASAAALNLMLNFLFVPHYGYLAAAITTTISYVFYIILSVVKSKSIITLRPDFKSLTKAVVSSMVMMAIVFVLQRTLSESLFSIILSIFIGMIVYVLILLFLGEGRKEITFLLKARSKNGCV